MMTLILFLIYIAMILAVILFERKNPTEALLWVIVLICLPGLGMVLYLIFGNTLSIKITAAIRTKRLKQLEAPFGSSPISQEIITNLSDSDQQVMQFNHHYNGSELTCYNTASIYTTGKSHYEALFNDIANAKECIYVEFYTSHHDQIGQAFIQALTQKARQGVKVLVLCDFIANIATPNKMFKPLRQAGGHVIRVKPYFTHYRSHRKIVVIDHNISFIGGMNIGKQYANLAKKKNPWRDTQVRMEGACCLALDRYFLTDWLCSIHKKDISSTLQYIQSLAYPKYHSTQQLCQFVVGGVDTDKEGVKMCYLSMIRSAKHHIRIQTPYFIPDTSVLDALKTALATGVAIEIMVPGISASFFLDPVTNYYCGQLLEYGATVNKYEGYIHAKTMIIDEELCCIGSVNLDMRSLMVDDEVCGVFYDNELVNRYLKIFKEDLIKTRPYTYQEFINRSTKEKLMESIFVLFAPLF